LVYSYIFLEQILGQTRNVKFKYDTFIGQNKKGLSKSLSINEK